MRQTQPDTERRQLEGAMSANPIVRPDSPNLHLPDAVSETRRLIEDLDRRIVRQQRRVEKIILDQLGPREDMETLLDDMIKARDMMRAQVDSFSEGEEATAIAGRGW